MIKSISHIDLSGNQHIAVMGVSRHGKTYAVKMSALKHEGAVLFFNTQHEEAKGYTTFDPNKHTPLQLYSLIKNKRKINFLPSTQIKDMNQELTFIINMMYEQLKDFKIKFIIDETHLFKKEALFGLIRLATTGLRWNKECVFLTQRPAMMENNLLTQSTRFIIFKLGEPDYQYLKNQSWNVEKIKEMTPNKYEFVEYDMVNLKGTFKIK